MRMHSGANPSYTADELVYQIQTAKATVLFLHPDSLSVGLAAACAAGIRSDRIVLFDRPHAADVASLPPAAASAPGAEYVDVRALVTLDELVHEGLAQPRPVCSRDRWLILRSPETQKESQTSSS